MESQPVRVSCFAFICCSLSRSVRGIIITIVLNIDANENMKKGKLSQMLCDIGLKELYSTKFPGGPTPVSWFRGSKQIDRIWVSGHID